MAEEATREEVERACLAAFTNAPPKEREEATLWLQQYAKTASAWKMACQFLNPPHESMQVQFAMSNMLLDKVRREWHMNSNELCEEVKQKVVAALDTYIQTNQLSNVTVSRLSLVLVTMALLSPIETHAVSALVNNTASSIEQAFSSSASNQNQLSLNDSASIHRTLEVGSTILITVADEVVTADLPRSHVISIQKILREAFASTFGAAHAIAVAGPEETHAWAFQIVDKWSKATGLGLAELRNEFNALFLAILQSLSVEFAPTVKASANALSSLVNVDSFPAPAGLAEAQDETIWAIVNARDRINRTSDGARAESQEEIELAHCLAKAATAVGVASLERIARFFSTGDNTGNDVSFRGNVDTNNLLSSTHGGTGGNGNRNGNGNGKDSGGDSTVIGNSNDRDNNGNGNPGLSPTHHRRKALNVATNVYTRYQHEMGNGDLYLAFADLMLNSLTNHYVRLVSRETFDFWLCLQDIPVAERHPAFRQPCYQRLLEILVEQCTIPSDTESLEDLDYDFESFRSNTDGPGDLFSSSWYLLQSKFFEILVNALFVLDASRWPSAEAILFTMSAVARDVRETTAKGKGPGESTIMDRFRGNSSSNRSISKGLSTGASGRDLMNGSANNVHTHAQNLNVASGVASGAATGAGTGAGTGEPPPSSDSKQETYTTRTILFRLFSELAKLPVVSQHPISRGAAATVMGDYAAVFSALTDNPQTLQQLIESNLEFVLRTLEEVPQARHAACVAVQRICANCGSQLATAPHVSAIIGCLDRAMNSGTEFSLQSRQQAAEGCSRLTALVRDATEASKCIESLVSPAVNRMTSACERCDGLKTNEGVLAAQVIEDELRYLTQFIQFLKPESDALRHVVHGLWPILRGLAQQGMSIQLSSGALDALYMMFAKFFNIAGSIISDGVGEVLNFAVDEYRRTHLEACLSCIKTAVEMLGKEKSTHSDFTALLDTISSETISALRNGEIREHPEVLGTYFELLHRYFLFAPEALFAPRADENGQDSGSRNFEQTLQLVTACVNVPEREVARSALTFMSEAILRTHSGAATVDASGNNGSEWPRFVGFVDHALQAHGQAFCQRLLLGIAGDTASLNVPYCISALYAVISCYNSAETRNWIIQILSVSDANTAATGTSVISTGAMPGSAGASTGAPTEASTGVSAGVSPGAAGINSSERNYSEGQKALMELDSKTKETVLGLLYSLAPTSKARFRSFMSDFSKVCRKELGVDVLLAYCM